MAEQAAFSAGVFDSQAILNGVGHGILIFGENGAFVQANDAARALFGADMRPLRESGWEAALHLFNPRLSDPAETLDAVWSRALASDRPLRFRAYFAGEYVPCWAAAITGQDGRTYFMLTVEQPDWDALHDIVGRYIGEVDQSAETTNGHAQLISQTLEFRKPTDTVESIGRKIGGFARIIHIHMHRLRELSGQMDRFAAIRTDRVREAARKNTRRVKLADFMDNFIENIQDDSLADPETDMHSSVQGHRRRIKTAVPPGLLVSASPNHFSAILRDVLRNAIMYSMKGTPVDVIAHSSPKDGMIQIDVVDQGYGVRGSERDRVFMPFARARQPQIIGEFGYGLSMFLCKHEVEAMGGRMWFTSEEGRGTTFSIKLPVWKEEYGEIAPAPAYPSLIAGTGTMPAVRSADQSR